MMRALVSAGAKGGMRVIRFSEISKTYRVVKRREGLRGSAASLCRREYR